MTTSTPPPQRAELIRGLGTWDAALLTIGSVIGTGIFITTADIARVLPSQGMILLVWVTGGLLTVAGALTYAELFEVAAWLRKHYGEATSLLQPAIGILGYETNFRMIDHAGLVTPGLRFYSDADATPMDEVLRRFKPDLVLLS